MYRIKIATLILLTLINSLLNNSGLYASDNDQEAKKKSFTSKKKKAKSHLLKGEEEPVFDEKASKGSTDFTVMKVLDKEKSKQYIRGKFPSDQKDDDLFLTSFCPPIKEINKAEKLFSENSPSPSPFPLSEVTLTAEGLSRLLKVGEELEESVLSRVVSGKDGRAPVKNPKKTQFRFIGHIIATYPSGNRYTATGFMVGPHHVLTAGHAIYDHKSEKTWAQSVEFAPAQFREKKPFRQANGTILLSFTQWVEAANPGYDMGMIILDQPIGYRTGWAGLLTITDPLAKEKSINITGYPAEKGGVGYKSTEMWGMSHKIKSVQPQRLFYDIDTTPGQSGSPILTAWGEVKVEHYAVGVHTNPEITFREGNKAVRITVEKFCHILEWMKLYQHKDFIHPNLPESEREKRQKLIRLYEQAGKENAQAQYGLAKLYEQEGDPIEAEKWYREAANRKHVEAMKDLGVFLLFNKVKKEKEAKKYLEAANKRGNREAEDHLNFLFIMKKNKDKNYKSAFNTYSTKAKKKDADAQYLKGYMYKYGRGGTEPNPKKSLEWYNRAARKMHPFALYSIGVSYFEQSPQNMKKAVEYFEKAKSCSYHGGWMLNMLGIIYCEGKGETIIDLQKGIDFYNEGIKQNYSYACRNLGYNYLQGKGVIQDKEKALELFLKAEELGCPEGWLFNTIGTIFSERNEQSAMERIVEYFEKGRSYNYGASSCNLGVIAFEGKGKEKESEKDWKAAVRYFEESISRGHKCGELYNTLGIIYGVGQHGVEQDKELATRYFFDAVKLKNQNAEINLVNLLKTKRFKFLTSSKAETKYSTVYHK